MEPDSNLKPKPVSASHTIMTELMIPSFANFGGKIHGGILLSMMDKAAYACAAKHAGGYCVTVSVENVDFKEPISVGELVSIYASVNYVGRTSLVIGMRVVAENVETGLIRHTNTSYFTMVAKDKNEQPTPVPPLILETREDARRFLEAMKRRKLKSQVKDDFDNEKSRLKVDAELPFLSNERCIISFEK